MNIGTRTQLLFQGTSYIVENEEDILIPVDSQAVIETETSTGKNTRTVTFDITKSKFRVKKKIVYPNTSSGQIVEQDVSEFPGDEYPLYGDFSVDMKPSNDTSKLPYTDVDTEYQKVKTLEYGLGELDDIYYYADVCEENSKAVDPDAQDVWSTLYRLYEWSGDGWLYVFSTKYINNLQDPVVPDDRRFLKAWANRNKADKGYNTWHKTQVINQIFRGLEIRKWNYSKDSSGIKRYLEVDFFNPQTYVMNKDDNLQSIAYRYNVTVEELKAVNNIVSDSYNNPGDVLLLPRKNVTIPAHTQIQIYSAKYDDPDTKEDESEAIRFDLNRYWNIRNDLEYLRQSIILKPAYSTYSNIVKRPNDIWKSDIFEVKYAVSDPSTYKYDKTADKLVVDKDIGYHYYIRKTYTSTSVDSDQMKAYKAYLQQVEDKKVKKIDSKAELDGYISGNSLASNIVSNALKNIKADYNLTVKNIKAKKWKKDKEKTKLEEAKKSYYKSAAIRLSEIVVAEKYQSVEKSLTTSDKNHTIKVTTKGDMFGATINITQEYTLIKSKRKILLYEWSGGKWVKKIAKSGKTGESVADLLRTADKTYADIWDEKDASGKSIWKDSMKDLPEYIPAKQ